MAWQDYLPAYRSVRFIEVKNWKLALSHIIIQLAVILYVVVYSIVIKQSYQEYEPLVGTTAIKVKGSAQQNGTMNDAGMLLLNGTVYDSYDLVIPPTEPDALFIATNIIRTLNQTRGTCAGNDVEKEVCTTGCIAGTATYNGIMTGVCDNTTNPNATVHFCDLRAWCPLEYENKSEEFLREHLVHGVEQWSIFARANIKFPKFNESKTNAPHGVQAGLNQWTLKELVENTGFSFHDVASTGAIVLVTISYECNLDHSIDDCHPDIHFQRIDPTSKASGDTPGFNFRYVDRYFDANGVERRALTKAYGVRILFQLIGKAGKFDFVPLLVALGSGLGLLSVATIVCDFVMQNLLPARRRYKREKIIDVADEDPLSPQRQQQQPHVQDGREPLLESGSFVAATDGMNMEAQHGPRTFST